MWVFISYMTSLATLVLVFLTSAVNGFTGHFLANFTSLITVVLMALTSQPGQFPTSGDAITDWLFMIFAYTSLVFTP